VAEIALAGADVRIPPAVYTEVVTRGGSRPDARIAARLITAGYIRVIDAAVVGQALEDLLHYQLGRGWSVRESCPRIWTCNMLQNLSRDPLGQFSGG
jgi:hypothetical protein